MKRDEYITASEIGDFVYCKRGWWLRLNKMLPNSSPVMDAGTKAHETLASELENNQRNITIALSLIGIGIVLVILVILIVLLVVLKIL